MLISIDLSVDESPKAYFDKTETLLAAVLLGGEGKPLDSFLICVVRGLLGPLIA
jgi:hypothetical protein